MAAYYKIPKLYGMENIATEEVRYKLNMFQSRFVIAHEFGGWYMEIIQTDTGIYFTLKEFQEGISVHGV